MATAVSWLVGTVLMFLEFGVLACSAWGIRRRPRFYMRFGCASLVMLGLAVAIAFAINFSALPQRAYGPLWLALLVAALAVAPVFCYHTFASGRGPSDDDGGGGGGGGPGPRPRRPDRPLGDTPLPDADQARARRRDHDRPRLRGFNRRRPAIEPGHRRAPSPGRR